MEIFINMWFCYIHYSKSTGSVHILNFSKYPCLFFIMHVSEWCIIPATGEGLVPNGHRTSSVAELTTKVFLEVDASTKQFMAAIKCNGDSNARWLTKKYKRRNIIILYKKNTHTNSTYRIQTCQKFISFTICILAYCIPSTTGLCNSWL